MSWDTAFEKHNNADFSAMTVWGVFYKDNADDGTRQTNIILLDAVKKRVEFPELKQWAIEAYREWSPDGVIIEKRASGAPLIYELRRMGIPVQEYTPTKGNDKISRLNSIADIFASGFVWAPDTRWAEEVIDELDPNELDIETLATLPRAVRSRVIRRAIYLAGAPAGSLSAEHIEPVEALVTAWKGQGPVSLPGGVTVARISGRLSLS